MALALRRTCLNWRRGFGLSSRHPLATALAHEARVQTPLEGVAEEPGQGIRAVVDGHEARLGQRCILRHPGSADTRR